MRSIRFVIMLAAALALFPACSNVESIRSTSTITVKSIGDADIRQYETIGKEFGRYSMTDLSLTPEQRSSDEQVLEVWRTAGSTIGTYAHVAPRYVAYVNRDSKLTATSKAVRMDNVAAWKMVLDHRQKGR